MKTRKVLYKWPQGLVIFNLFQDRWNRQKSHVLASCHDGDIKLWDIRKPSLPTLYVSAHLARIFSLDWSRVLSDRLVTSGQVRNLINWSRYLRVLEKCVLTKQSAAFQHTEWLYLLHWNLIMTSTPDVMLHCILLSLFLSRNILLSSLGIKPRVAQINIALDVTLLGTNKTVQPAAYSLQIIFSRIALSSSTTFPLTPQSRTGRWRRPCRSGRLGTRRSVTDLQRSSCRR